MAIATIITIATTARYVKRSELVTAVEGEGGELGDEVGVVTDELEETTVTEVSAYELKYELLPAKVA